MGREVKRVPVDFDHALNEVWPGYLMGPEFDWPKCPDCQGECYGPEARAIAGTFYRHQIGGPNAAALAWVDKLGQAEVDHLQAEGRLGTRRDGKLVTEPLTAAEVNAANGESRSMFGTYAHDAINRCILISFRCAQLGIVEYCLTCEGNGDIATPEQRESADAWERTEPPTGDGYQLWETVSEGSPISPVFDSAEGLAEWMSSPTYRWGADSAWPYDAALRWINGPAWAPTFITSAPS